MSERVRPSIAAKIAAREKKHTTLEAPKSHTIQFGKYTLANNLLVLLLL